MGKFLAHEMEKAHELGADIVSLLHICPALNEDFRKVTSPALVNLGDTAIGVWKKLVKLQDRFLSVTVEELFGGLTAEQYPEIKEWVEYIHGRYGWIREESGQHSRCSGIRMGQKSDSGFLA